MALSKAEIRSALRQTCTQEFAGIPPESDIDYTFSPAFCQRMDALIREQKRGSWRLMSRTRRRVLVVAAILITALLLVACTPPLREAVVNIMVEFLDGRAAYTVTESPHDTIETVYVPGVVPEGFVLESREQFFSHFIESIYRNTDGCKLTFTQSASQLSFGSIDTDSADVFIATVDGTEVLFAFSEGFSTAFWSHDGYSMALRVPVTMEQEAMERIVASLQPAE